MKFFLNFLKNLGILVAIGIVIFLLEPEMMRQVFDVYGLLFGPIALLFVVVAALPRKRNSR